MNETTPKRPYRLYALPLALETVELAAQYRYSRATPTPAPGYILVYTDADQPEGSQEITAEQIDLLTAEDARWLCDSRSAYLFEEVESSLREMKKGLPEIVAALETELKRKKEELAKGGE